ncbi:BgTH12-05778 [Blumeria graminis f. sp. triticale]|uniref:BgTH12-05778 n=1 Tax=Blumeria graminis f. sp. triticale TaxID=1689686 RepID=A0A9W4DPN8_BLUGR|nr:BgTH12-05778 [Blumeria graminis f. sp. triticale]
MSNTYGTLNEDNSLHRHSRDGEESPIIGPLRIRKGNEIHHRKNKSSITASQRSLNSIESSNSGAQEINKLHRPDDLSMYSFEGSDGKLQSSRQLGNQDHEGPTDTVQKFSSRANDVALNLSPDLEKKSLNLATRRGSRVLPITEQSGSKRFDHEVLPAKQFSRDTKHLNQKYKYPELSKPRQTPLERLNPTNSPNHTTATTKGMKRFSSAASISTTRASRGSPPPPETPMTDSYELSSPKNLQGWSGSITRDRSQTMTTAQSLNYTPAKFTQVPKPMDSVSAQIGDTRPWTPTESENSKLHSSQTVYQGSSRFARSQSSKEGGRSQLLEQELQQMHLSYSPPPAYSSVSLRASENMQQISCNEKRIRPPATTHVVPKPSIISPPNTPGIQYPGHPAFSNDARRENLNLRSAAQMIPAQKLQNAQPSQDAGPSSPPPLPEGWISHLDQNSGHYYYIHLPTRATQWEFPKGPTPLNHDVPPFPPNLSTYGNPLSSPRLGTFIKTPLASPGFSPCTPGYTDSTMSVGSHNSMMAGYSGPPPSSGVDMYKIAPTNGVYFGPYLRYINMNIERGIWLGSIMLVTDAGQPPTIHIHQSVDLSPNPRQLVPNPISTHQRWTFYRYDVDLQMSDSVTSQWTYAVTSHLGCSRFEFVIAGRQEKRWRFIAQSGNDFAINTSVNERSKLGGTDLMWKDVLQKNKDCGGFHVQLGLGDQIYGDRLWKEIPLLKQWLAISGKENRKGAAWTARHEEDVLHAYFHYYTSHFDQPYLREAFAQIPHMIQIDDHDIFDGFGSYPESMQLSNIFKNIGRIGLETYLLFQHHTTLNTLRKNQNDLDLFTITGSSWHFLRYLGPAVVVVGLDCRSERNQRQILAGSTYQGIFPRIMSLPPSVQHCIWMISKPIIFPRLDTVESIAHTITTAKKGVTGTYNLLGKMTSSVAGVVGGKQAVASGFSQVKRAVGKSGLMGGVLNAFGDIDLADELRDMWTHESKDLERTYMIRTLQGISLQKGIRMTFVSGDVGCSGAGLVHDPSHPGDYKTMYQVIASPIIAAPAPNVLLKMLHNNKTLYVPVNGQKTSNAVSDTKEDMMEIFQSDTNGVARDMKKLMGRRNYVTFTVYSPMDFVPTNQIATTPHGSQKKVIERLCLAIDFVVQDDGNYVAPTKYGPVIIPNLE